jgi:hypothetical protein
MVTSLGYSQSLCGDLNFRSPIGGAVLVVVDVAVVWMKSPHNVLVASLVRGARCQTRDKYRPLTSLPQCNFLATFGGDVNAEDAGAFSMFVVRISGVCT